MQRGLGIGELQQKDLKGGHCVMLHFYQQPEGCFHLIFNIKYYIFVYVQQSTAKDKMKIGLGRSIIVVRKNKQKDKEYHK